NNKCPRPPPIHFANLLTISLLRRSDSRSEMTTASPCWFFLMNYQSDKEASPPCDTCWLPSQRFAQKINN
ncbi:hypothetical protein, partial [Kosakonia cowanii]|uniref:hypothetical protein n=1 Tax=Kosakonia cowanii TaxID=208223 RepID=UPI00289EB2F1